jgi:hypothetical protein
MLGRAIGDLFHMTVWGPAGPPWKTRSSGRRVRTWPGRPAQTAVALSSRDRTPATRAAAVGDATRYPFSKLGTVIGLGSLGLTAVAVTVALTHKTMGYGVDSAVYLGQAHNLVTGRGPTVPMTFYTDHYPPAAAFAFHGAVPSTHFPPLYAALLALLEAVGLSAGARFAGGARRCTPSTSCSWPSCSRVSSRANVGSGPSRARSCS